MTADPFWLSRPGPPALLRTALAHRAADLAAASGPAVRLQESPPVTAANLRTERTEVLGVEPPPMNRTVTTPDGATILRLGPDELLVESPTDDLLVRLGAAGRSLTDVSAARAGIDLTGPRARDVLAKGCAVDLHPATFPPGGCAQTTLARTNVLIQCLVDGDYRIRTGSSFGDYLADWLIDAAAEFAAR